MSLFFNATDAIFVTDGEGRVLLAEEEVERNMGLKMSEIIGEKVEILVRRGAYSRSTSRECLDSKQPVSGLFKTQSGRYLFSSTKPILNKDGSVRFTVTNTRDYGILESFAKELEREGVMREKYKKIADYLQEVRTGRDQPLAESDAMRQTLLFCRNIAKSDSVVLITGETGTGKEVCAEYIFQHSRRNKEPFLPVNCSAIPGELLERIVGYEMGAFTGRIPGDISAMRWQNTGPFSRHNRRASAAHSAQAAEFSGNGQIKGRRSRQIRWM